jgi:hypothetical protein
MDTSIIPTQQTNHIPWQVTPKGNPWSFYRLNRLSMADVTPGEPAIILVSIRDHLFPGDVPSDTFSRLHEIRAFMP